MAAAAGIDTGERLFSPQAAPQRKGASPAPQATPIPAGRTRPRSLAGATILQLVPSLSDDPAGHAAADIALTLLHSGARAMVAGDGGPLVGELRTFGGEWLPMAAASLNPVRIVGNARQIGNLIASERIDIVHAHSAAAAWAALNATSRQQPVFLVTSLPDRLTPHSYIGNAFRASLTRGHRVIAPSSYIARAMIERYKLAPERITVIPRAIDTETFSPAAVSGDRIGALRRAWGILPEFRIVLVPGRIAPWNGQMSVIDAAPFVVGNGARNIAFVFAGSDRGRPRYLDALRQRAALHGVDTLCRFVGHCPDMPAALAAADAVVVPSLEPPLSGRAVSEAQAMARPVVTTTVGMLPENILCPPRMREGLRTGWLARPGHAGQIGRSVCEALNLNDTAYEALGARARQFAEFMFSPPSVAAAIRGVYTSLLARDL
ncbi:MAG TPA: glycosyltransferase [Pseudolabrys sp.]|jgi:glycosyltransferase involved in cell wall biosynthesis|nr:glycosyltransferase [Pseudolabrys sp.]